MFAEPLCKTTVVLFKIGGKVSDILLFLMIFFFGMACGGMFEKFLQSLCKSTKVGTLSASHNSAMLEIALILREFVADSSEHGITDTKYYWQKIDAVVAQLQQ